MFTMATRDPSGKDLRIHGYPAGSGLYCYNSDSGNCVSSISPGNAPSNEGSVIKYGFGLADFIYFSRGISRPPPTGLDVYSYSWDDDSCVEAPEHVGLGV